MIKANEDSVSTVVPQDPQAAPSRSFADQSLWQTLQSPSNRDAFIHAWLPLQCASMSHVARAVVVLAEGEAYAPAAFWPDAKASNLGLTSIAELALQEHKGVLRTSETRNAIYLAHPLVVDNQLTGVVALGIEPPAGEFSPPLYMRQLQWGMAWLELRLRDSRAAQPLSGSTRMGALLSLLASTLEHGNFQSAATALATDLATQLQCERVSIGLLKGKRIEVKALSHSANFTSNSSLTDHLGMAMDEAMEQQSTLVHPQAENDAIRITQAHGKLSRAFGAGSICTVPLCHRERIFGALTLERPSGNPFDATTVELCETLASMAGPILEGKFREDRWLLLKVADACVEAGKKLVGPGHQVFKLIALIAVILTVFFSVAKTDYRITADTHIEGEIQRVIAAPLEGYISEAFARAGDIVKAGQIIARMDDRNLQLERQKWLSEREQHLRQYRDALANSDRSEAVVRKAQVDQADAELALVEEQLLRTQIAAPLDGLIISGDLSQSLGAPVARGDTLFEIAPLKSYRVILDVDERDTLDLQEGQKGQLVLTGETAVPLPFAISKITPVSEAKEGRNVFRVEAQLESAPTFLRPGMKGIGKIDVDRRKLIWVWTHKIVDWLRLWFWEYWP